MTGITIDSSIPFNIFILTLKSINNRKIRENSDNYFVLKELYQGSIIDDYENKPINPNKNIRINNIKSRISDLKNKYNINIISSPVSGKRHKEYFLSQRASNE